MSDYSARNTISAMLVFGSRETCMQSKARRLKKTESQHFIELIEYFVQIIFASLLMLI